MANGDKPTVDEHYIPQMYLKGFSTVKTSKKPNKETAYIWQFNVKSMQQTKVPVNVCNICFEKDLYEIRDNTGSIVAQNYIERIFGLIENNTRRVINSIIHKSQNEKCLNCSRVFSEEDKSYLIIFLTSLLYRDPQTIERGIKFLEEKHPNIDRREARNFTLMNLLPLNIDPEWDKNTIIRSAVLMFDNMFLQVGITDDDIIITSDRPLIIWPSNGKISEYKPQAVAFPLTSRLVLYLYPTDIIKPDERCCFFKMNDQYIKEIQLNTAMHAQNWIYSKNKLSDDQLKIITEARVRMEH